MNDRKKYFVKILAVYFIILILFSFLFILSFHTPLFLEQRVLFYRGLFLLLIITFTTLIICLFLNKYFFKVSFETLFASLILAFCFNLSFFIVFPVTFDRSVTTYLLSAIKEKSGTQTCGGLPEKQLEQLFIDEYVLDQKAVSRRIKEQSIIKTVEKDRDCVKLTQRGDNLLNFLNLIKKLYSFSDQKY